MNKFFVILFSSLALSSFGQAPDFNATDSDGTPFSLYEDYLSQGKTVLIEFFFTDCAPCADSAPFFEDMYQAWGGGDGNVEFFGISHSDNNLALDEFRSEFSLSYPMVGIAGGGDLIGQLYNSGDFGEFYGYPTYVIIAPDGSMAYNPIIDNVEILPHLNSILEDVNSTGTVSIAKALEFEFSSYPNPATETIHIETNAPCHVSVTSLTGNKLFDKDLSQSEDIDCSAFPKGIYFVQIQHEQEIYTSKFFKR